MLLHTLAELLWLVIRMAGPAILIAHAVTRLLQLVTSP